MIFPYLRRWGVLATLDACDCHFDERSEEKSCKISRYAQDFSLRSK